MVRAAKVTAGATARPLAPSDPRTSSRSATKAPSTCTAETSISWYRTRSRRISLRLECAESTPPTTRERSRRRQTEILSRDRSRPGRKLPRHSRVASKSPRPSPSFERRRHPRAKTYSAPRASRPSPDLFRDRRHLARISRRDSRKPSRSAGSPCDGRHPCIRARRPFALIPLFALCDRHDVAGISYTHHPQIGHAAIFLYDGQPGGVGLAVQHVRPHRGACSMRHLRPHRRLPL